MQHTDFSLTGASVVGCWCPCGRNIEVCTKQVGERFGRAVVIQLGVASALRRFMDGG